MLIVNRGSSVGWTAEALAADPNVLGVTVVSVLYSMLHPIGESVPTLRPVYQGLVKEAFSAMKHDLHGLSVLQDMIQLTFNLRHTTTAHKDFMYVMELTEKYYMNLRSLYDFLSKVLRLAIAERDIGKLPFDSLNDLISFAETERARNYLPTDLIELLRGVKDEFMHVRTNRDFIIHSGKQISIMTGDSDYKLGPFNERGELIEHRPPEPEIYHELMPYLAERTNRLLDFAEGIGIIILREFQIHHVQIPFYLYALEGTCIPSFVRFLGLLPKTD